MQFGFCIKRLLASLTFSMAGRIVFQSLLVLQALQGSQASTPVWEAAATSMTRAGMRRKVQHLIPLSTQVFDE